MPKWWHLLKPNHGNSYPTRFIFFDTETKQVWRGKELEHEFWFGYMIYHDIDKSIRHETAFETQDQFWDFIDLWTQKRKRLVLVAHNAFFDFMSVGGFKRAKDHGWILRTTPIFEKGLFIATFTRGEGKKREYIEFLNLGNWFKMKLSSMGEVLGFEKLEMPSYDDSFDKWIEYCKRDAEIVERMVLKYIEFLQKHDLGKFSKTIASQAFHAYRHRFMKNNIFVHAHEEAIKLERECYHGGRSEAFYIGKINNKVYVMDVHSMYPSVMIDELYPIKFIKYKNKGNLYALRSYMRRGYLVIAEVLVETDKPVVPKKAERLIAPIGRFRTVLTTPEINYLLETGGKILDVYRFSVYEGAKIFSEYVKYFYHLKETATNKVDYLFVKLFLNSLYGKFGQRSPKWQKAGTNDDYEKFGVERYYDPSGDKWINMRTYAGIVEVSGDYGESYNSFVAIAAHVTGYSWVKLTRAIAAGGFDNVYYCDTDSIFTNEETYKKFLDIGLVGEELGKFGLEKVADTAEINGVKDYVLHMGDQKQRKLKGVSKASVLVLTKGSEIEISGKDELKAINLLQDYGLEFEYNSGAYHIKKSNTTIALVENEFGFPLLSKILKDLDVVIKDIRSPGYAQLQWLSMASHIRKGYTDKYTCQVIVKHLSRKYEKGIITKTGRVKPFVLRE